MSYFVFSVSPLSTVTVDIMDEIGVSKVDV